MIGNRLLSYRLVAIGDLSVGKTSLLNRFVDDHYIPYSQSTVGAAFQVRDYEVDGERIQLQLWDTAGHERYRSVIPFYFRDALGAVMVFDLTSRSSFKSLDSWIASVLDVAGTNCVIGIAANKSDLKSDYQVTLEEGQAFAHSKNAIFAATSAKTGSGVKEFFQELIGEVVKRKALRGKLIETGWMRKAGDSACLC